MRRTSPEELIAGLTGATVLSVQRRGKYLLFPLDTGDAVMVHLRMSGQLFVEPTGSPKPPHTHVTAVLDDGNELWFVDPRTFGEVVVFDPDRVDIELPPLARLGIDPIVDEFPREQLRDMVRSTSMSLKPLLLDQTRIAGIGSIYADEILHRSRLRPDRAANTLDAPATWRLHSAIVDVLNSAIDVGGSTLADAQYVDVDGEAGRFQDEHRVYGLAGQRCSTCGRGWIRRTTSGGRTTHYCPVCQH